MNRIASRRGDCPLVAAFLWLAATIAARPFALPDEGRYAGVAWGMVTSGDWLVPRLDGLPYFHKPPLFYWITAFVMQVAGPVEWAARIAPLLGATAAATALTLFARRWCGERFARHALVVFSTQVLVFIGAQFANLDMLVAGCITVTTLAAAHAALVREEGGDGRGALAIAWLFGGLGVLAKGLIGIVLPGMVIVAWLLLRKRWRVLLSLLWWPGALLFLAVAAPWFVLMQRQFAGFLHYFFYVQQFARYAQGGFNNQQPALFYPVVLLVLAFPWSLWLLAGLRRHRHADPRRAALKLLAWTWLVLVTLFFSLPQSKLVGYIFPVAAPLAFLGADVVERMPGAAWRWRASVAAAAVFCASAVTLGTVHPLHSTRGIGMALRASGPADQVVFLKHYWFDVPVYGRLVQPVRVIDEWDESRIRDHDNWRKELADAAQFDPALGRALLLASDDATAALCTSALTWVAADGDTAREQPVLAQAQEVATEGDTHLWRLPAVPAGATRPGCPGTPSGSSGDRS